MGSGFILRGVVIIASVIAVPLYVFCIRVTEMAMHIVLNYNFQSARDELDQNQLRVINIVGVIRGWMILLESNHSSVVKGIEGTNY